MISIIIPVHNERENLEQLLPQLIDLSSHVPVEIIVSLSSETTDGSEKMVLGHEIRVIGCTKKGRAIQMNEAALVAKGAIVVFLHADVKPPRTFLSDIERTITQGYDAGFFSYRFDKENAFLKINAFFTSKDSIFTGGGDQCLFIRKSIFDELGGFNSKQVLMEDFEFFERMKKNNIRYKIIKNDLIVSARKYRNNSYLRVNLANLLLVLLFKLGYPATKLKILHNRLIHAPCEQRS